MGKKAIKIENISDKDLINNFKKSYKEYLISLRIYEILDNNPNYLEILEIKTNNLSVYISMLKRRSLKVDLKAITDDIQITNEDVIKTAIWDVWQHNQKDLSEKTNEDINKTKKTLTKKNKR